MGQSAVPEATQVYWGSESHAIRVAKAIRVVVVG